jgi:hypothetical protein
MGVVLHLFLHMWHDVVVCAENFFLKERAMTRDKTLALEKEVLHLKQLIGELKRPESDGTAGEGCRSLLLFFARSFVRALQHCPVWA